MCVILVYGARFLYNYRWVFTVFRGMLLTHLNFSTIQLCMKIEAGSLDTGAPSSHPIVNCVYAQQLESLVKSRFCSCTGLHFVQSKVLRCRFQALSCEQRRKKLEGSRCVSYTCVNRGLSSIKASLLPGKKGPGRK